VSLVIRAIRQDEIQILQDFIRDHWNAEHAFVKSAKLLRWQHFDNPFKSMSSYKADELSFMGAWEGNSLIAVLGEIPLPFTCRGEEILGTWLALWKNSGEERYPSAGIQLLHHITSGPSEFIGGIGMHPRVRRAYALFKFRVRDDLPLYLVINPEVRSQLVGRKNKGGERFFAREKSFADDAQIHFNEPNLAQAEAWDSFWSRIRKEIFGVDRRFSYIAWRYLNHPYYDYQWAQVLNNSGEPEAAAVYRIEPAADEKVMHVVEFLGSDAGKNHLAGALCDQMRKLNISFLGFRCAQITNFEPWRKHGGAIYEEHDTALEVSSLFQPVVPEYHPLTWGYRVAERHQGISPEDCYVTRSDGDQDRPNRIR
jgi:hypothetical protein